MTWVVYHIRTPVEPPLAGCVYYDFDPTRDAKLVENAEEIILDRVRADFQLAGNFTIGEARGQTSSHVLFPAGKQYSTLRIYQTSRRRFVECPQQILNL